MIKTIGAHFSSYQVELGSHLFRVVKHSCERSEDSIIQVVHHGVQLAILAADFPLGMYFADQCVCGLHKEASWLGNDSDTLIGKTQLH